MIIFTFVYFYPILLSVFGSFKLRMELFSPSLNPFPLEPTLHNYFSLFGIIDVINVLKNSMLISLSAAFTNAILAPLVAYPLSKAVFRGRRFCQLLVLFAMVQPFIAISIPLLGVVVSFGLMDNLFSAVLPFLIFPLIVYFFMQSLTFIPDELIDSARLDGAGELRILYRIILPMIKATVAGAILLSFMNVWNNYIWQLLVLRTAAVTTFPVAVGELATTTFIYYGETFALMSVYIVPLLIVFFVMQKQIVAGMVLSGIKG